MQSNVTRSATIPDRDSLEHRFTDTPDDSLAGSWWVRNALSPWCLWTYDVDDHRITVTRGTATRSAELPRSALVTTDAELRKMLPLLALHLARERRRLSH